MPLTGRIWFEASFKRSPEAAGGEWSLGPPGSQRRRGRAKRMAVDEEVLDQSRGLEAKPYPWPQPSAGSLILFSGLSKSRSLPPIFSPQPQRYCLHEAAGRWRGREAKCILGQQTGLYSAGKRIGMSTSVSPALEPWRGNPTRNG